MENATSAIALAPYDIFIIILYMVGMMVMGAYYSRYVKSSEDFFLSGKRLPWWSIGMSLVSTDISAVDYLGVAGMGYAYGIVVANFDWIGCLPPLILAAFIFMPYFWRAGIYTIPEYLGRRYNQYVRVVHALLWGVFLICNLAVILWATGKMFVEFVPIGDGFLWGSAKAVFTSNQWWAPHWRIMVWIFVVGFVVAFYTISGGISAVTMTDVAQLILMFVGGAAVIVVGLYKIGGIDSLKTTVLGLGPEYQRHFDLFLPADSKSPFPWTGIMFGLAFVLAPAYWIGNQAIIQRTLGARSEWDAKAGTLYCGLLHALIPLMITMPGLIGLALFKGELGDKDTVFPRMIHTLLPKGMTGLVFAAFLAALMSTLSSVINSAATIWTKDIYQAYFNKTASDRHLLNLGRGLSLAFIVMAACLAPVVEYFGGIYQAIQNFLTFIQGPSLALLLLGMLWKRTTGWGGLAGLLSGMTLSVTLFIWHRVSPLFIQDDPFLFIAWWSFVGAMAVTVIVSLLTRPHDPEQLRGLVYASAREDQAAQAALERRAAA